MAGLDTLKRAPKWAWFTVAGVGLGAAAIRVYNGRATDEDVENVPADGTDTATGVGPGGTPSGVIVPPVIIPDQSDPLAGVGEIQALWIGAVQDLTQGWQDVYNPIASLLPSLIPTPGDYMGLITAGADIARETPVVSVSPVPQVAPAPAPAPAPAAAPKPQKRATDTCHSAYNKDGNCWTCSRTFYSDGSKSAPFDCHKVHNGKCSKEKSCG